MKITNLDGIKRIRMNDFSEYDSEKCRNGGCYGFWTDYDRVKDGWEISYGTTSDLEYCPVCGCFNNHYVGDEECEYSCGEYEIISDEELLNRIKSFEKTENCYIDLE